MCRPSPARWRSSRRTKTRRVLLAWVEENHRIHERDCINLNPATNVMNPRAEAAAGRGLGSRPSLGYPGDKYEMGLEAIEQIEVIAAELAAEVFDARYAEIRVGSGRARQSLRLHGDGEARRRDHRAAAGDRRPRHPSRRRAAPGSTASTSMPRRSMPTATRSMSTALRDLARALRPKLITIGGSLNLFPHPDRRRSARSPTRSARWCCSTPRIMSGMIAGRAWQQPLAEGAHLMTMSTYKSLGGPPAGLIVTNDAEIAERLDAHRLSRADREFRCRRSRRRWRSRCSTGSVHGRAYARGDGGDRARRWPRRWPRAACRSIAAARGVTTSHQFALEAARFGGGQAAAKRLRQANVLACGIGLPIAEVDGDINGLRLGTPEIVRWGMTAQDMPALAGFIADVLTGRRAAQSVAPEVAAFRSPVRPPALRAWLGLGRDNALLEDEAAVEAASRR